MHQTGEIEGFLGGQGVAMHDVERVAGLPHVQPRQCAPSAADGVESASLAADQHTSFFQRRSRDLFCLLDRL